MTNARANDGVTLARGALINGATLLVANLRGVFTFLVARVLGSAALGSFGMAWALMDIISRVGVLGLDTGTMTLVARREAVADRQGSYRLFKTALRWGLLISTVTAVVAIIATLSAGGTLLSSRAIRVSSAVMLTALPGMALYRIANSVSRGLRVMRHDFYSHGIAETSVTLLCFVVAVGCGYRTLVAEVSGVLGVSAAGLVAVFLAYRAVCPRESPEVSGRSPTRELFAFSTPIAGYSLLNVLMSRLDVLLLGIYVGRAPGLTLETYGVYCAAVEIAGGLRKVRLMFDPIFAPVVAAQTVTRDHDGLHRSAAQIGRWVMALQLPMFGVLVVVRTIAMSVFGESFRVGTTWLVTIAIAQMVTGFAGLAETVIMVNRPRLNLINSAVTTVFYAAIAAVFIPRLGPIGAAAAALVTSIVVGLTRFLELRFALGWQWPWKSQARPLIAFGFAIVPALITRALLTAAIGIPGEIVAGIVFLVCYLASWWVLGIDADDRATLAELRSRRRA